MGVKTITVQQNREYKMAKEIKRLREEWKEAAEKGMMITGAREERYNWYTKGIEDALGFVKLCELVELSREVKS